MVDSEDILTQALQNDDCFREEVLSIYLYYFLFDLLNLRFLQLASINGELPVIPLSPEEAHDFDAFIQQRMNDELQDQVFYTKL